jgi:hypothetical protein
VTTIAGTDVGGTVREEDRAASMSAWEGVREGDERPDEVGDMSEGSGGALPAGRDAAGARDAADAFLVLPAMEGVEERWGKKNRARRGIKGKMAASIREKNTQRD